MLTAKQLRENARHARLREQWKKFLQADKMKCCICGYNKCFAALDHHHSQPGEKDFEIGTFMQRAFTDTNKAVLLRELGKCLCMCRNCHAEFHAYQRKLNKKGETQ